jgi:Spy/CpxP family protein refolding chaperone
MFARIQKMMRFFGKFVLTLSALALVASPAWAQGRGGSGGGAAGFLMAPNVQKDLKLTDTQVKRVQETLREITERHQADYSALRDASPDVRWTKMATLHDTVSDEVKNALSLSAEQSKRFDQIGLQAHGLRAFASRTVDEKLKLTDDQKSKIREIVEATRNSNAGASNNDASEQDRTEARNKRAAAQKENMAKVHALLTDDQKQGWQELIGEPIHIDYPARRSND